MGQKGWGGRGGVGWGVGRDETVEGVAEGACAAVVDVAEHHHHLPDVLALEPLAQLNALCPICQSEESAKECTLRVCRECVWSVRRE